MDSENNQWPCENGWQWLREHLPWDLSIIVYILFFFVLFIFWCQRAVGKWMLHNWLMHTCLGAHQERIPEAKVVTCRRWQFNVSKMTNRTHILMCIQMKSSKLNKKYMWKEKKTKKARLTLRKCKESKTKNKKQNFMYFDAQKSLSLCVCMYWNQTLALRSHELGIFVKYNKINVWVFVLFTLTSQVQFHLFLIRTDVHVSTTHIYWGKKKNNIHRTFCSQIVHTQSRISQHMLNAHTAHFQVLLFFFFFLSIFQEEPTSQ